MIRDQILAADTLKTEKVPTPEWPGVPEVIVSEFRGVDREAFEARFWTTGEGEGRRYRAPENARGLMAALTIVDETGKRVFSEADIPELGQKSARVLMRIWDVAVRLNKLGDTAAEDAAKNSEPGPGAGT